MSQNLLRCKLNDQTRAPISARASQHGITLENGRGPSKPGWLADRAHLSTNPPTKQYSTKFPLNSASPTFSGYTPAGLAALRQLTPVCFSNSVIPHRDARDLRAPFKLFQPLMSFNSRALIGIFWNVDMQNFILNTIFFVYSSWIS